MFGDANNGATEIPDSTYDSQLAFLASPIRYWWTKNEHGVFYHDTPLFNAYNDWREKVRTDLLAEGYLTYAPHMAFKGPWNEKLGTAINNFAVSKADLMVALHLIVGGETVEAVGTSREVAMARERKLPIYDLTMTSSARTINYQNLWEVLPREN